MKYCFLTFRSVTHAQRGEAMLNRRGIHCTLLRTPRWMEEQGCGYTLRLRIGDREQGEQLLRTAGVPIRKVYLQRADGKLEEMAL